MTTGTAVDRSPFEQLAEHERRKNEALKSGKAMVTAGKNSSSLAPGEYGKLVDKFYADIVELMAFEAKLK